LPRRYAPARGEYASRYARDAQAVNACFARHLEYIDAYSRDA